MDDAVYVARRGAELLTDPILNKGTAFTHDERRDLGLTGLLPDHVSTLDQQVARVYANYLLEANDLARHGYLRALQDRNETLFYALLLRHLREMLPIVYTPTVALACRRYSHIYQKPRGIFVTPNNVGDLGRILHALPHPSIELIVATDNQRILGIGDQGVGGMGIPIGKGALYVAAAGLSPSRVLPVSLDVGTDNQDLLADPLYLGLRQPRLKGGDYRAFLAQFVAGVRRHLPGAILQWEDLGREAAFHSLETYRHVLPSFNDDIQGTAAMTLGGLLAAERITGRKLTDSTVVILGAGEAGLGLARQLRAYAGDAFPRERLLVLDRLGLLVEGDVRDAEKREFAVPRARIAGWALERGDGPPQLLDVVRNAAPHALVAATGQPGAISEAVVRAMTAGAGRPIIFPLSNPTSHSEATPADLALWSGGRAIVATGSPFPPVILEGAVIHPAQANNVLIFPGVGLGALVAGAREVTDDMFSAAAAMLGRLPTEAELRQGLVFPSVERLREVSHAVAVEVARVAFASGHASAAPPDDLAETVRARMWEPVYAPYVAAP